MEPTDSELVIRAVAGDDRAFDALVSRYRSRVYYLALSKVGNAEAARDLAQEAFVQAYLSLSALRESEKFGSWLAAIASNLSAGYLRRPRELVLPVDQILDMRCGDLPIIPAGDDSTREILQTLPDGARTAAVLYFVQEMRMNEIAEFLGIALSAVKSRIRTARSHIKKEMVDMVRQTAKKHEPGDEFNHTLAQRLELARWYRELSELFEVGVNLRTALGRLAEADYSESIREATLTLRAAVDSGSSMHEALASIPALVAPQTIPMIKVGETSGRLEWSVATLADRIEAEEAKQSIELSFWCRVLGGMWQAGVPMVEALRGTAEATRSKPLSQAAIDLAQCVEEEKRPVKEVLDKYSDVLPPMLRVVLLTGIPLLSYKLDWVGARIAEDICRHVVGRKIEVPAPHVEGLAGSAHLWADSAIGLLEDGDPGIRAAAAEMLGRFKASSAAPALLRLLDDPEPKVITAAIRALVDLGSAPPTEVLTARLAAEDPSVRRAAVQALKELDLVHETAQHLAELLADPDERVAHAAICALEDAREIEALGNQAVKLVRDSKDPQLRCRAAAVLDKRLFPAPEAMLVAALADELPAVRYMAARLLGHSKDARAVPVIREAIQARHLPQDYLFLADDLEKG